MRLQGGVGDSFDVFFEQFSHKFPDKVSAKNVCNPFRILSKKAGRSTLPTKPSRLKVVRTLDSVRTARSVRRLCPRPRNSSLLLRRRRKRRKRRTVYMLTIRILETLRKHYASGNFYVSFCEVSKQELSWCLVWPRFLFVFVLCCISAKPRKPRKPEDWAIYFEQSMAIIRAFHVFSQRSFWVYLRGFCQMFYVFGGSHQKCKQKDLS